MRVWGLLLALTLGASPAAFEALREGDTAALTKALDDGASPNAKDSDGQTLLVHSVVYLPVEGVRLLLDRGADVNLTGTGGATALMAAAGDLAKVRLLIERGADVNARSAGGNTPLRHALALPGGRKVALHLLRNGAKAESRDLSTAARRGDLALLRALLEAGAAPNDSAVLRAIGNTEMLELLEAKAPQFRGDIAHRKVVTTAAAPGSGLSELMSAAYYGRVARARALVELGADLNAKDNRGRTVLMYAVGGDTASEDLVRLLLARGANAAAKDVRGDTALDVARQRGRKEIILALGGKPVPLNETAPPAGEGKWRPLRENLVKSVSLLEAAGPEFYKVNGCISCHSQSIPQMAVGVMRNAGIPVNEAASKIQGDAVISLLKLSSNNLWQMGCSTLGGYVATLSYDLVGLAADRQPRSQWTDLASNCLAKAQQENGAWATQDVRHPLGESESKYTALSLRGLLNYPLPGLQAEYAERIARAAEYLESTPAADTQSLAFRILGLKWAGRPGRIPELARKLESMQRVNGGWAQQPEMPADAYATAVVLWALHEGAGSGNSAWQQGAAFLRRTQQPDGSWHVRSRGFGFQPYRETGFPYGHDQWLSSAATGFAVLALAPLL